MNAIEALGSVVKQIRLQQGLTQSQVAEKIGVEARTIMYIENGKTNPTWEIVFPLIRALEIDPRIVFYPELNREDEAMAQIEILLSKCSDEDIQSLIPICETILKVFHDRSGLQIRDK